MTASEPLSHLRVAIVADDIAARYCARLFANLGADVSEIRPNNDGSPGPYDDWLDERVHSVTVLDDTFDAVVAGSSTATIATAEQWCADHASDAVLVRLTWFDPHGPYADWPATDEIIHALAGVAYSFGEPDGPPTIPSGHSPQLLAGLNAFTACLAALAALAEHRPRHVDVNVLESVICLAEIAAVGSRSGHDVRSTRLGVNRYSPTYPTTAYRTLDGWVGLSVLTPSQWAALCTIIGRDDLADDPRFAAALSRLAHADAIDEAVAPVLAARTTDDLVSAALAARVPLVPMRSPGDLPSHPHWEARGTFPELPQHPGVRAPRLPFRVRPTRVPVERWTAGAGEGPLSGLRVADFTMGWAGPLAARMLADLGADVVKVEHDAHPDWWRGWDALTDADPPTIEIQTNFNAMNRGKRGVCFDLRRPEGIEQARGLIASADVVIDNFAAGVLTRLGLGPDVQRELQPNVISLAMPAFGTEGPLAEMRAYGTTVEQSSGLPFVNGEPGWPPCLQHVALGDPISGMFGAAALLAAIVGREHVGGSTIELVQVECLFQLAAKAVVTEQLGRAFVRRPHVVVRTAGDGPYGDEWVVAVPDVDHPMDPGVLQSSVASLSRDDAAAALRANGVAAAPIRRADEVGHDPQHDATGLFAELDRRYVGPHAHARQPFRLDGARPALCRPAPTLGQHTGEVLAELAARTVPR